MKIRIEVEPGDVVRMGQRQHVNVSHDLAKQLLAKQSGAIEHELKDVVERHLVRIIAIHAQEQSQKRRAS